MFHFKFIHFYIIFNDYLVIIFVCLFFQYTGLRSVTLTARSAVNVTERSSLFIYKISDGLGIVDFVPAVAWLPLRYRLGVLVSWRLRGGGAGHVTMASWCLGFLPWPERMFYDQISF